MSLVGSFPGSNVVALLVWCLLALLAYLTLSQTNPVHADSAPANWLELSNLQLIDGTGAPARPVRYLIARNGVITGLGDTPADPEPLDVLTRVDLGGAYVIPGLIDAHVHLSGFPGDRSGIQSTMEAALRGGITSVRDMAGDLRTIGDAQRAMLRDEFLGLSLASSALFGGPDMFGDPRVSLASIGHDPGGAPWAQAVSDQTDLAAAVAMARGAGADGIKLYGNLDAALIRRISAEAHRQGLKVWAHATVFPARPSDLLDANVDVLSHAPYLVWEAVEDVPADYGARRNGPYAGVAPDDPAIRRLLARMAAERTVLDTTLMIYRDVIAEAEGPERGAWAMEAFAWGVAVTRLAHELGVPIAAGTDRFLADPWSLPDLHAELAVLVEEVGMTPGEALQAATRNAALAAGLEGSQGTLAVGKVADVVVLGSNPLQDITASKDIRLVIKSGEIVHRRAPH